MMMQQLPASWRGVVILIRLIVVASTAAITAILRIPIMTFRACGGMQCFCVTVTAGGAFMIPVHSRVFAVVSCRPVVYGMALHTIEAE
jgi:hypothetical protein